MLMGVVKKRAKKLVWPEEKKARNALLGLVTVILAAQMGEHSFGVDLKKMKGFVPLGAACLYIFPEGCCIWPANSRPAKRLGAPSQSFNRTALFEGTQHAYPPLQLCPCRVWVDKSQQSLASTH